MVGRGLLVVLWVVGGRLVVVLVVVAVSVAPEEDGEPLKKPVREFVIAEHTLIHLCKL